MTFLKQHLLWLLLLLVTNAHATTHYVKHNASGANNGTSWTDAFTDLQDAINAAVIGDEVWVAAGTYKPNQYPTGAIFPTTQDKTFYLNKDIKIYGGFTGTETVLSQRNYIANITTLSGDIGVLGDSTDNCFHVFITKNLTSTAEIDGFTIRDGNANNGTDSVLYDGIYFYTLLGGGFYNHASSPLLKNISFTNNTAIQAGGGMTNLLSSTPTLINISFINNKSNLGGGIYNFSSSPILTDVSFDGNLGNGAGMYNNLASPILTNVSFTNNIGDGAGMYNRNSSNPILTNVSFINNSGLINNEGAMYNRNSAPILTNVSFINNSAYRGGGMHNYFASPTLTNVSFTNNSASDAGAAIYNSNSSPIIRNTIIWGNLGKEEVYNLNSNPTFSYCILRNSGSSTTWNNIYGTDGGNNLDSDPLFYGNDDVRITTGSSAFNTGNNTYNSSANDINGNVRLQNGTIDIGAIEGLITPVTQRYYVKHNATGANNGSSWADAFTDLQAALNIGTDWDTIWVAAGTYKPTQYPTGLSSTDPRSKTFYLSTNLKLFGGFVGTETQLTQRNFVNNPTILSGDIGATNNNTDNSYHILIGVSLSSSTIIDGFTIKNSNADGTGNGYMYNGKVFTADNGGGMYYHSSLLTLKNIDFIDNTGSFRGAGIFNEESAINLENCTFDNNGGSSYGGAMSNLRSSPTLSNVIFTNNSSTLYGAGMYNMEGHPILSNVTFTGNTAHSTNNSSFGGGIYSEDAVLFLTNISFINNTATGVSAAGSYGGGIYNNNTSSTLINVKFINNSTNHGGGMRNIYSSTTTLINVAFIDNSATGYGGGLYNSFSSTATLTNVTFSNNSTTPSGSGDAICNNNTATILVRNSNIWGNGNGAEVYNDNGSSITFYHSIIDGSGGSTAWNTSYGTDGGNNLDIDPLFVSSSDVLLQTGSPAIDAGDNSYNTTTTDLAGNSRITNNIIDLGAYEYNSCPIVTTSISDTIYQDEIYTVGTSSYNTTGNYTDTLQTWQSCDSIITLNLLALPVTYVIDTLVLGESYVDYYCFNVFPTASTDTLMNVVSTVTSNNCLTFYGDNLGIDSTYYYTNTEKVYFYLTVENGVWPGDTDDDALVNNSDLLNIGLAYGTNGIQRDSQTIQWNGYLATDWGTTFTNGLNYKHADADGNGIVNGADTLAIVQNWGLTYNKNGGNTGSPIYLAMDSLSIQNDVVSIPVVVGTAQEPLTDLYGVVFSISYDNKIVQANSMNLVLDNNTWFGNTADMLTVEKEFSSNEVFEYGITRINQTAISGHGQIGYLNFTLNQNALQGNDSLFTFEVFNVTANNNIGTTIPMQGIVDDINLDTIVQLISSTENIIENDNFKLYPNPVTTQLNIEIISEVISEVSVFDRNGKQIKNILCQNSSIIIDFEDISSGIYFVRVITNKGIYTSEILKL